MKTNQTDTDKPLEVSAGVDSPPSPCSADLESRYAWRESNLRNFDSWAKEITHAESLGYKLVPPEYYLSNWSTAMSMGASLPKIYVMREDGPDELGAHMDCYTAHLGYPVYFKPIPHNQQPTTNQQPNEKNHQ